MTSTLTLLGLAILFLLLTRACLTTEHPAASCIGPVFGGVFFLIASGCLLASLIAWLIRV